jgi:hypothetical protein
MLVIHTYQNLLERNTLDARSGNNTIYETYERANVHDLDRELNRRDHD